jgi:hypothetical protein
MDVGGDDESDAIMSSRCGCDKCEEVGIYIYIYI